MDFYKLKQELFVVNTLLLSEKTIYVSTKVKKIGDKVKVEGASIVSKSIKELKQCIENKPIILLLNGDKILYSNDASLFKSAASSFYTTKYEVKGKTDFMALARKNEVDDIVKEFLNNNFFLIEVSIGNFSVGLLYKNFFNEKEFFTGYLSLIFDDEDFIGLKKIPSKSSKVEIDIEKEAIIAISSIYNHHYPSDRLINDYENSIIFDNKQQSIHKSEFQFYGKFSIIIIFTILFLSYGVTMFFSSQNEKIESKLNYLIKEELLLDKLTKEKSKKEEILQISGLLDSEGISFWTHLLIKNIPKSILLSEFNVFPLKQQLNKNKKIDIQGDIIMVKGSSLNEIAFNNWIKKLVEKEEVFKIDIINYTQKKQQEVIFELRVELKK